MQEYNMGITRTDTSLLITHYVVNGWGYSKCNLRSGIAFDFTLETEPPLTTDHQREIEEKFGIKLTPR